MYRAAAQPERLAQAGRQPVQVPAEHQHGHMPGAGRP